MENFILLSQARHPNKGVHVAGDKWLVRCIAIVLPTLSGGKVKTNLISAPVT